MNTEELQQLGLSNKEATLYLASLELGKAKASDLANYTGINRGTIYDVARTLFKHGLMGSIQQGRITYFVAHSPENFIEKMSENLKKAHELMPEIESVMRSKYHRPKLRFYEGVDGLKAIYGETLKCQSKKMLQFVSVKAVFESVGKEFAQEYVVKRIRRHIYLRAVNDQKGEIDDKKEGYSSHTDAKLLRESRLAPASVNFPSIVMVYDDKVVFISTKKENFGFIIGSRESAAMMSSLFEIMWNISKPV